MGAIFEWSKSLLLFSVIVYGAVPLLLYFVPSIQHNLIFMSVIKWPFTNYTDPRAHGVKYESRNFYLNIEPSVRVGCWHVLPKAMYRHDQSKERDGGEFEELLSKSGYPIVMYMHGNTWTRAASHRLLLYNVLSELNMHVVVLDYRGFADSTGIPTEDGINRDVHVVFQWIKERAGNNAIFLWGHSLGTAVATRLAQELCEEESGPTGLILEAPFNNLAEIIRHHPFTAMFRWLPWFEATIVQPVAKMGLHFNTDQRILRVCAPVLILHAKDDRIIPFHLAKTLQRAAESAGRDTKFVEFDHPHNYGHKYIINAPELPDIVYEFVEHCYSKEGAGESAFASNDNSVEHHSAVVT